MFFVMFLFFGGIVWLLGLVFATPARQRVGIYSALSLLFVLTGLILFTLFSWWAGIIPLTFGDGGLITYSVSFPEWYMARGVLGIAIILVGLLGVVSPTLAVWLISRQSAKPRTVQ